MSRNGTIEVFAIANVLAKKVYGSSHWVDSVSWVSLVDDPYWFEATVTVYNGKLRVGVITFASDVSPGATVERGLDNTEILREKYGYDFILKKKDEIELPNDSQMAEIILKRVAQEIGKKVIFDCFAQENVGHGFVLQFQIVIPNQKGLPWRTVYSRHPLREVYSGNYEMKLCKHPSYDYEID